MRRSLIAFASVIAMCVNAAPGRASDDTILRRVAGSVGYTQQFSSPYVAITGQQILDDGNYAVVTALSQGLLTLPDSSLIGIGGNSRVQVSAFKRAASGSGSTITIPSSGGTLRFDIKHPSGAAANYTFVTPTSTVSARGTIGLLSSGANGDVISCVQCASGDVAVTVGSRVYPLVSGQTLVVS